MSVTIVRVRKNPLDLCLSTLGMTRASFGAKFDLGKPYLLRLSQGRHSRIGEYAERCLFTEASEKGIDLAGPLREEWGTDSLEEAYDKWVADHRTRQTIPDPSGTGNPFQRLVTAAGGVARMAALLAVPDPLVERYAKGITPRMPGPIRQALTDMRYPHIEQLDEAVQKWFSKRS